MASSEFKHTREFGAQSAAAYPDIKELFANLHDACRSTPRQEGWSLGLHFGLVSEIFGTRQTIAYWENPPNSPPQITVIGLLKRIEDQYKSAEHLAANLHGAISKRLDPVFKDKQVFTDEVSKVLEITQRLLSVPEAWQKDDLQRATKLLKSLPDNPEEIDADTWDDIGYLYKDALSGVFEQFLSAKEAEFLNNFGEHCMQEEYFIAFGAAEGKTADDIFDEFGVETPEEPIKAIKGQRFRLSELVKTLEALQSDESMSEGNKEKARSTLKQGENLLLQAADYYTNSVRETLPGFDPEKISIPALLDMSGENTRPVAYAFYAAALTQLIIPEFQSKVLGKKM